MLEYRELDTPIGTLLVAATERGVVYVGFAVEGIDDVLAMLAAKVGPVRHPASTEPPNGRPATAILDTATRQIGDYLAGTRREFDLPLDVRLASGFRGQAQQQLAAVAYGHTATYAEIAAQLGRPSAVRAVGTACATNPLPLIWPCHRVLRSDGGLGGYRGGLDAKRYLLTLETA